MNLSRVVVIVAVTAAIVYTGLNFMLPRSGKTPAAETAATTEAAATGEAPAAAEPAAEAAGASPAEAPAAEGAAAATAEDPALTEAEARQIAANVASEVATRVASESAAPTTDTASTVAEPAAEAPASEAPVAEAAPAAEAATAEAGGSELTDEQKRRIAANVARESSGASEPVVEAAAAPEPETVPAPKPEPKAVSKPAPKAAQVAAAEPSSAPAPRAPKAAKAAAAPTRTIGNGQDVISAWWKKQPSSDRLNLVYAGEASSEKAVVLMFDNAVDGAAADSQIKLVNAKGDVQSGSWTSGGNPRLIAFKGVPAGRYTVIVAPAMADTSGKTVGSELVGPVYVH